MSHTTVAKHSLYILGHTAGTPSLSLLPKTTPGETLSVILVQDAVSLADVPGDHVYALADDAVSSEVPPGRRTISYEDMARMIFEADHVVAL